MKPDGHNFIRVWIVSSIGFYFAPYVLDGMVVTGNSRLGPFLASIISGFLLATAINITTPVFESLKIKLKDDWQAITAYLFVNVLGIWVIARYADLTGVGISNAWIAVLLGAAFNFLQWISLNLGNSKRK